MSTTRVVSNWIGHEETRFSAPAVCTNVSVMAIIYYMNALPSAQSDWPTGRITNRSPVALGEKGQLQDRHPDKQQDGWMWRFISHSILHGLVIRPHEGPADRHSLVVLAFSSTLSIQGGLQHVYSGTSAAQAIVIVLTLAGCGRAVRRMRERGGHKNIEGPWPQLELIVTAMVSSSYIALVICRLGRTHARVPLRSATKPVSRARMSHAMRMSSMRLGRRTYVCVRLRSEIDGCEGEFSEDVGGTSLCGQ
ncbi:hypothetical protein BC826DRAFT_975314 [Russula brevipes]|nr:hypothetical protein BC826DRAFT_975314 [Russula brevipes]